MASFDSDSYIPACDSCGQSDNFKRIREVEEVEILNVSDDGQIYTDDSDLHVQGSWKYECIQCGNSSDDLEDLLEEKEDEDDDEW